MKVSEKLSLYQQGNIELILKETILKKLSLIALMLLFLNIMYSPVYASSIFPEVNQSERASALSEEVPLALFTNDTPLSIINHLGIFPQYAGAIAGAIFLFTVGGIALGALLVFVPGLPYFFRGEYDKFWNMFRLSSLGLILSILITLPMGFNALALGGGSAYLLLLISLLVYALLDEDKTEQPVANKKQETTSHVLKCFDPTGCK